MAFPRWDPVRDLLAIQQRLDRFAPGSTGWSPPVDLHETPNRYVLTAEVPGLQRDDLRIDLRDGLLRISGVRRQRPTCEKYHQLERGYGAFTRAFQLQAPVDGDAITADLRDGVLLVTCPKVSGAGARRIPIA